MLIKRILTACILIPLMVAAVFYLPSILFLILMSVITLGAAWEWTALMGIHKMPYRFIYLAIITVFFFIPFFIPILSFYIVTFTGWLIAFFLVIQYPRGAQIWGSHIYWRGLMGIFVLIPCWASVNLIRNAQSGPYVLMFLFVLIWGADTMAYFVGRAWGKTKLAPLVSPGKSREGVAGAIVFAIMLACVALQFTHTPKSIWLPAIGLCVVTVLFSILGDLFESMIKRQIGVKDSGNLLPGHGGLLDRIDSLTAAAPIFVLGGLVLSLYL